MKQISEIKMTLKKSVVHSVVYEAKGSAVPTIYIKKDGLPQPVPKEIILSITVGKTE